MTMMTAATGLGERGAMLAGAMDAAASAFIAGLIPFAIHAGITFAILVIGISLYVLLTPHKELKLVREGNPAAAISLSGIILGLAIPLAVSMANSLNWADVIFWGAATLLVQLIMFVFVDILLPGLSKRINERDVAAATVLAATKLATAVILAAAVTGAPLARI